MAKIDSRVETEYLEEFECLGEIWVIHERGYIGEDGEDLAYGVSHKETGWGVNGIEGSIEEAKAKGILKIEANVAKVPKALEGARKVIADFPIVKLEEPA